MILTRNSTKAEKTYPQSELISWDAIAEAAPSRFLEGVKAVIHLCGEGVASGRWTKTRKEAIRDSRVIGTRNLVEGLLKLKARPQVLLSGSAIGCYGNRGDEELDESSTIGKGFLAEIGHRWESEAARVREGGVRLVLLRTGIVLSHEGGALKKMLGPFKKGVGGRLGHGRPWMSWIHIEDEVNAILFLLSALEIEGPVNLTAPNPVTNKDFTKELAQALGRRPFLPAPAFALRLMMGEMADELLRSSQKVKSKRLEAGGFKFGFPQLSSALSDLLK